MGLLATVVVGVAAAPAVVWLVASGLQRFDDAVWMTRVMFPYIALMSLVALAAGILNTWRRFAVPAATPVLLNLAVIGAALWGAPWFAAHGIEPIYALAAGTMLGGVLQLAVQFPALRAHRLPAAHRAGAGAHCAAALAPSGRATRARPDGAGAARRVGGADLVADQHPDRVAAGGRVGGAAARGAVAGVAPHRLPAAPRFCAGRIAGAWRHPGVRRVLGQMAPAILGVSVAQISLLINTHIASRLASARCRG